MSVALPPVAVYTRPRNRLDLELQDCHVDFAGKNCAEKLDADVLVLRLLDQPRAGVYDSADDVPALSPENQAEVRSCAELV